MATSGCLFIQILPDLPASINPRFCSFSPDKTNSSSLKDCVTFLHFIDYQIAKLTRIAAKDEPHPLVINIINNIITHMNNTITSIQPLDQFFSSMDMFPSGFHLILHLLWCTVSVLYRTVLYMSSCEF